MKARSRLAPSSLSSDLYVPKKEAVRDHHQPDRSHSFFVIGEHMIAALFSSHTQNLHWLGLGLPGWLLLSWVLSNWYPSQVANLIVPNAYLPVVVPLFWSVGWTAAWVWQNARTGWVTAGFISIALWLRVLSLQPYHIILGSIFAFFLVVELSFRSIDILKQAHQKKSRSR